MLQESRVYRTVTCGVTLPRRGVVTCSHASFFNENNRALQDPSFSFSFSNSFFISRSLVAPPPTHLCLSL